MKELAGKIVMHIQTLVAFGATIHEIKFAKFHFSRWQSIVRKGTVVTAMAFSLHVVKTYCVGILMAVVSILVSSAVSLVALLRAAFVFSSAIIIFASSSACGNKMTFNY